MHRGCGPALVSSRKYVVPEHRGSEKSFDSVDAQIGTLLYSASYNSAAFYGLFGYSVFTDAGRYPVCTDIGSFHAEVLPWASQRG